MKKIIASLLAGTLTLTLAACDGGSSDTAAGTTAEATTAAEISPEETIVEEQGPANVAEGIDPYSAPQEWWDEYYRNNNCVSQDIRFGGLASCLARGVDMDNNDTMLVFFVDQDEAGVQDHFAVEQRRDLYVDALAGIVGMARWEGDPRLQHVTDVRVIASGGEGFFSGWQGETTVE